MRQYCRYCVHLCTGNGTYCAAKEKLIADNTAKSANRCKQFEFCEIDAFGETDGYKPRNKAKNKARKTENLFEQVGLEI